jgi:ribosome-binding ATPase YchF (GTP1/OBG family)
VSDIETINTDSFCRSPLSIVSSRAMRKWRCRRRFRERLVAVLEKCQAVLNEARPVRSVSFYPEEQAVLRPLCLLTAKPAMYVANVRDDGFANNPHLEAVRQHAARESAPVVAVCAAIEPRSPT